MNGFFYGVVNSLFNALGQDVIFIILLSCVFVSFLVNFFICIFRVEYGIKKRLWQLAVSAFSVFTCSGFCAFSGQSFLLSYFIAGFSALFFVPILAIREKKFVVTEKQKDFVRFIDREIKNAKQNENFSQKPTDTYIVDNDFLYDDRNVKKTATDFELDFQHVKNVISRLDYFGLKESDKRQVKELENALLSAEKGDFDLTVKSRINDGLGALLKIMSKYGV
ncbi:MAG: hypothetical protein IJB32_03770 [Clostridia bacterium]|nr:hypothetical protein [Clostridia bacterium]